MVINSQFFPMYACYYTVECNKNLALLRIANSCTANVLLGWVFSRPFLLFLNLIDGKNHKTKKNLLPEIPHK